MLTAVISPAVVPVWASQVSVEIDHSGSTPLADVFPGMLLPDALSGAVRKRQVEFLAGRMCARSAIRQLDPAGLSAPLPMLPSGAPGFPTGLVGSITHAGGFVSAAVARATAAEGIGIDSEVIASARRASRVMRRIATAGELDAAASQVGRDRAVAVTLLFSAKEALFKCLCPKVGRTFDYRDVRVEVTADGGSGMFRAVVGAWLSEFVRRGAVLHGRFEIDDRFVHTGLSMDTRLQ